MEIGWNYGWNMNTRHGKWGQHESTQWQTSNSGFIKQNYSVLMHGNEIIWLALSQWNSDRANQLKLWVLRKNPKVSNSMAKANGLIFMDNNRQTASKWIMARNIIIMQCQPTLEQALMGNSGKGSVLWFKKHHTTIIIM